MRTSAGAHQFVFGSVSIAAPAACPVAGVRTLVVHESTFGTTRHVAAGLEAEDIGATLTDVGSADPR